MQSKPQRKDSNHSKHSGQSSKPSKTNADVAQKIISKVEEVQDLRKYPIRDLVKHAEDLGTYLAEQNVKTNQLRKFLDAVNRIKAELAREKAISLEGIEVSLQMLKPKLAYAVVRADKRQEAAISALRDAVSSAIDHVQEARSVKTKADEENFKEGFYRLVQLIESTIAYHKAAGGKNQ
jgi:CRISPR-associated protein Csm2